MSADESGDQSDRNAPSQPKAPRTGPESGDADPAGSDGLTVARNRILAERRAARRRVAPASGEAADAAAQGDAADGDEDEADEAAAAPRGRAGPKFQPGLPAGPRTPGVPQRSKPAQTPVPQAPAPPTPRVRPPAPPPARQPDQRPPGPPLRARPLSSAAPPLRRPARRGRFFVPFSFILFVLLPGVPFIDYLWNRAADQYHSIAAFSVREEEDQVSAALPISLPGGIGGPSDADILNEFIGSQQLVEALDARLDLRAIYNRHPDDWMFAFGKDRSIEDLQTYWSWATHVSYDTFSGLIEIRALAFTPEEAQKIAQAVLDESSALINSLSAKAREDAIAYARKDLDEAQERLRDIRRRLREFRDKVQTADPLKDVEAQMGVLTALQQALAEALVAQADLMQTTRDEDPRIAQGQRRIQAIEEQIDAEKLKLGSGGTSPEAEDLANTVGIFEELKTDLGFAEEAYVAAQAAFDLARTEARRQTRYVAAHVQPTLSQSPQYPQRFTLAALGIGFLLVVWGVTVLLVFNIGDRR